MDWRKEPAVVIVGGGTAIVQAFMQVLIAAGVPISGELQAAITALVGLILGYMTRANVTPMATLPPGVAGQIADDKAVKAAQRDAVVPPMDR
jgi:hypothetical protein